MPDLLIHWLNPSKLIQSHFRQSRLIQRLLGRALGAKEATIAKLPQGSPEDNSWGANQLASRPDKPQALGSRVNWTQGFSTPLLGQCEYLQSLLNTYWESEMESGGINPRRGDQLVPETLTSMVILKLILWVAPARNPAVFALPRQQPGKFYPPLSPSGGLCELCVPGRSSEAHHSHLGVGAGCEAVRADAFKPSKMPHSLGCKISGT